MRKSDDDLVNKCMGCEVEGSRSVRRTWLDSVEAENMFMTGKNMEKCYEEEVRPYRKTDYKSIYIYINQDGMI